MIMTNIRFLLSAVALAVLGLPAAAEINVVTTDTSLADIARFVGGDKVKVESLSQPGDDPHHVEPRPSMVVKLARAEVFARIGMDLDMYADSVLERCGNARVKRGGAGYADCSRGVRVLEVPSGKLDPSMGDIHVYGNPHYLLDPANGIVAAGNIAAALIRVDPRNQPFYHRRFIEFGEQIQQGLGRWHAELVPFKGHGVVIFHKTWAYFLARFGLHDAGNIEPKPGFPPTPGHVNELIEHMKAEHANVVLCETFRSQRFPNLIRERTGAKVVYVPIAVGAVPEASSYVRMFDVLVSRLAAGMR